MISFVDEYARNRAAMKALGVRDIDSFGRKDPEPADRPVMGGQKSYNENEISHNSLKEFAAALPVETAWKSIPAQRKQIWRTAVSDMEAALTGR